MLAVAVAVVQVAMALLLIPVVSHLPIDLIFLGERAERVVMVITVALKVVAAESAFILGPTLTSLMEE